MLVIIFSCIRRDNRVLLYRTASQERLTHTHDSGFSVSYIWVTEADTCWGSYWNERSVLRKEGCLSSSAPNKVFENIPRMTIKANRDVQGLSVCLWDVLFVTLEITGNYFGPKHWNVFYVWLAVVLPVLLYKRKTWSLDNATFIEGVCSWKFQNI